MNAAVSLALAVVVSAAQSEAGTASPSAPAPSAPAGTASPFAPAPSAPAAPSEAGTTPTSQTTTTAPASSGVQASLSASGAEGSGVPIAMSNAMPRQTVVFRHAREALRHEKPDDALRFWLLRNALVDRGDAPLHDEDFASVVWVALGRRGLCPDGYPRDDDGAGIWPLALHNFLLARMRKQSTDPPSPWPAFQVSRQQRSISLHDVLSLDELRTVHFAKGFCTAGYSTYATAFTQGQLADVPDLDDRLVVGTLMKALLERSRATVDVERLEHTAVVDARIFDLEVALVELRKRKARETASRASQLARSLGLPDSAVEELRAQMSKVPPASDQGALLRRALAWSPEAWLTLSRERRLALFRRVAEIDDPGAAETRMTLMLGILDGLIERGAGGEVEAWLGHLDTNASPSMRAAITRGARGEKLLALEPDSGFTGRSVISLHRAVSFLEEGSLDESLQSFGFALAHADESSASQEVRSLALRWLSYVASQFETSPKLVETLRVLASRRDVARILEDLLWRAALRADAKSFDVVVQGAARKSGNVERLSTVLRPLALGNSGAFANDLNVRAVDDPQGALRLMQQLVSRVESEEREVRRAQAVTLRHALEVVNRLEADETSSVNARAAELRDRILAILDGVGAMPPERERTLSPEHQAYAGSVRLAPGDPLPWPFVVPNVAAPSAFVPVVLVPVDKVGKDGKYVAAWSMTE